MGRGGQKGKDLAKYNRMSACKAAAEQSRERDVHIFHHDFSSILCTTELVEGAKLFAVAPGRLGGIHDVASKYNDNAVNSFWWDQLITKKRRKS